MTDPRLPGYPVVVEIPVQWGDMDAYGHVNNTVFFRFFESARVKFLNECGFLAAYEELKIGAILHSTSCRFRRALIYPDTVLVGARAITVLADRFEMEYRIYSLQQDADVATGTGTVVSFDYSARSKAPLPKIVADELARLEAML